MNSHRMYRPYPKEIKEDRNQLILSMRKEGHTLQSIANKFGCSREWIRKILKDELNTTKKFVFKPEKLKSRPATLGLVNLNLFRSPSFAILSIFGPAGYSKPKSFPDLSNASPAASSNVVPIKLKSLALLTITSCV